MRTTFHLYPKAAHSLTDRYLTTGCFTRLAISSLHEVSIRGIGSPGEFGGYTAEQFADHFVHLFEAEYGKAADQKEQVKRLAILFDEMYLTTEQQSTLLQQIANAFFIRGFKNIVVKSLVFPNKDESKPIYLDFSDDMSKFSAYYGDDRLRDHVILEQPKLIYNHIHALQSKPVANSFEKQKLDSEIASVNRDLIAAKKIAKDKTLIVNADLKEQLHHTHIKPYPAVKTPASRDVFQSDLQNAYQLRTKLQKEIEQARHSWSALFSGSSINAKSTQVELLNKQLKANDPLELRRVTQPGLIKQEAVSENDIEISLI